MVCQTSVIHETQKVPSSQTHSYKNLPYTESTPFQNKSLKPFFVLVRVNLAVTYKQIFPGWLHTNTSKIQENFKRISIEASEHRDAYISPPICFNSLILAFTLFFLKFILHYTLHCQGRIQKIMIGVVGTLDHYIDTFYFPENSIKIIQNFKEKKGWLHPSRPSPRSALDCDCLRTRVGQQDKILLSTKQHLGEVYSARFLYLLSLSLPLGFSTDNLQGCCLMVARSPEALAHGWLKF